MAARSERKSIRASFQIRHFQEVVREESSFIARFQIWRRAYSGSTIFDVSSTLYPRETFVHEGGNRRGQSQGMRVQVDARN